jgi:diadenosine tetraphosphate (Ap4A) HIT family hydrolase
VSSLDRLWAGWRAEYIEGVTGASEGHPGGCVLCAILTSGLPDTETHIVWRHPGGRAVAILNAYPYCSGHLMVMPTRHVGAIEELTDEEGTVVWQGIGQAVKAVKSAYRPDGLNIGANLGRAAGAGIPGHFHMHVLPRWAGDSNFMTSIAEARVLPETLSAAAAKIRSTWERI